MGVNWQQIHEEQMFRSIFFFQHVDRLMPCERNRVLRRYHKWRREENERDRKRFERYHRLTR